MQLSDLDGFLTAIAVSPEPIPAEEWLPVIWGGSQPEFRSARHRGQVTAAIMTRYHDIVADLERTPPVVRPVFWLEDGDAIVADWAEGFMDGVKLRLAEWSRLIASADNAILIPLALYWVDDDDQPIIHVDEAVRERIDDDAPDLIAEAVIAIRDYWKARSRKPEPVARLH